jgi:hypothetical protein
MRLPRMTTRRLMVLVAIVASLVWGAMMGVRSYDCYRIARYFGDQERGWRIIASRKEDPKQAQFHSECIQYCAMLSAKYRLAMWRPWLPVAPDPHAPGYDQWLEQERRAGRVPPDRAKPK